MRTSNIIKVLFFMCLSNTLYSQDPHFGWAKSMGGIGNDGGKSIVIDDSGNIYTTGYFIGVLGNDFDPGVGSFNLPTYGGGSDIFISKLDADGNFVWAKSMGGEGSDVSQSIDIDASGNVYTTGNFQAQLTLTLEVY